MASSFSACEDSSAGFEAGFNGQTSRTNGSGALSSDVNDIPRFRRGYSRYPKSGGYHGRNKDYPLSNSYGSSRHNHNENGPSTSNVTSMDYGVYNLTRGISRTNISQPNGGTNNHSKRYSRNRGQPLRETADDRESTNADTITQFNHIPSYNFQDHSNIDVQQPRAPRKWNHKNNSNYNYQSNGKYYKRRDPRHETQEVFENWRENPSHPEEHCDDRNASSSNVDENPRDGSRTATNDNYKNNRRGRRGKWPHNDGRQKFQSQVIKVERSHADEFCHNSDGRGRIRNGRNNKISEKTFENQRGLHINYLSAYNKLIQHHVISRATGGAAEIKHLRMPGLLHGPQENFCHVELFHVFQHLPLDVHQEMGIFFGRERSPSSGCRGGGNRRRDVVLEVSNLPEYQLQIS